MNPLTILALICEMYERIISLENENRELTSENSELKEKLEDDPSS